MGHDSFHIFLFDPFAPVVILLLNHPLLRKEFLQGTLLFAIAVRVCIRRDMTHDKKPAWVLLLVGSYFWLIVDIIITAIVIPKFRGFFEHYTHESALPVATQLILKIHWLVFALLLTVPYCAFVGRRRHPRLIYLTLAIGILAAIFAMVITPLGMFLPIWQLDPITS